MVVAGRGDCAHPAKLAGTYLELFLATKMSSVPDLVVVYEPLPINFVTLLGVPRLDWA